MAAILLAAAACGVHRSPPTIALSYPAYARAYATVAEALVRPGGDRPRLLVDTVDIQESAESMVAWAQRVGLLPEVVGVVGPSGSRLALATAPVYNAAEIPQVVPVATAHQLALAGPWTFPMAPDDSVEGAFLADYIGRAVGARRVILFYENDEFGQSLRGSLLKEFLRHGITVLAQIGVFPNSDFEPLLDAALVEGRPDALVMATRATEAGAIANLAASRLPGVPVVAADGALVPDRLVQLAGTGLANLRAVAFWVPDTTDPRQREFIAETRRVTGHDPDADRAMIQDGIALLTTATDEVGTDRTAIRVWLRSLGQERPAFRGITGLISFAPGRAHALHMVRIAADGRIVPEPIR